MSILFCKWEPVVIRALLDAGARVHVVLDQWDVRFGDVDRALLARAEGVYEVRDFDSVEQLSAVAVDLRLRDAGIRRVASFAEFSQYGAGLLAELLGVPGGTLAQAVATRDKREMKRRYRAAGIRCARSMSVPDARAVPDPAEVAETVGFPVVVKPVSGMGAMATVRVDRPEDLRTVVDGLVFPPEVISHQLIIEEYVTGEELHADAVWSDGAPMYFTVGRYPRPRLSVPPGEEGSLLLDAADHGKLIDRAEELHRAVNAAIGISSGPTHFEFFRTSADELVASEVATRFGGGPLLDMVRCRDGVDLRLLWADEMLGRSVTRRVAQRGGGPHVAGINIPASGGGGRVLSMPTAAELDADPHVVEHRALCAVGEETHGLWCLMLILRADSETELRDVVEAARRRYVVRTGE
ncbi:acetyl-CoA carboxylase biotin carboxylase subunit family protein [Micromonospora maritima]|uniref:acetyl-CoA carboxylase biotin carboxylase subunit family protein n=1 Tax=Micromonospora maritima TaxID=986711 RepID=UPI0037A0F33D